MTQESSTTTSWRGHLQRWRVPLGFISAVLFVLFSQPTWRSLLLGLPIAFAGALFRAWASGHLKKNRELATGGPYAFTRNPLYFGSFLLVVGFSIGGGSWPLGLWLIIFFWLIYWPVIQAEAAHVESLFGESYRIWSSRVPLFFPRLTPGSSTDGEPAVKSFDFEQYQRHREYRLAFGIIFVFAILIVKILWNG